MSALTTNLFRRLSETPGAPGDEGAVRDLIARAIYPLVEEMQVDSIGNLSALKRGTGASDLRVVVTAHMDEVALFVNEIDGNGFLHVLASGGVNARTLLGKAVQVGPERWPGVICWPPIHLQKGDGDGRRVPKIEDVVIDIGARDRESASARVQIGQRALFQTSFGFLGREDEPDGNAPLPVRGRIKGKAFDDRIGCAALISLLGGEPLPFDLQAIFTVQEEVGLRGARAAGGRSEADYVFVLEGTVCDDLPGPPGQERFPTTRLGAGPALTQRDRSHVVSPPLLAHLMRTAERLGIPYQFKHPNVGGTDAAGYALRRALPVGILSVPCRYIHGPVAVAELSDLHNLLQLLRAALETIGDVQPGLSQERSK